MIRRLLSEPGVSGLGRAARLAAVGAGLGLYALCFLPVHAVLGPAVGALGVVPVILAGSLLGKNFGIATGLVIVPINWIFFGLITHEVGLPGTVAAGLTFGAAGWVVGQLRDVTRTLRTSLENEDASRRLLIERERQLQQAQKTAHLGSWEWSPQTGHMWCSDELLRIYGLGQGEGSWQSRLDRIHPGARDAVRDVVDSCAADGKWREIEFRATRRGGGEVLIHSRVELARGSPGAVLVLGTDQDVTDVKTMQRRLQEADRMASIGTLAGGVAHEINNPLTFVVTNLQYIRDQVPESSRWTADDAKEVGLAIDDALVGSDRIRRIVKDLKHFSRPDTDSVGPVDVREVIRLAVNMASNEIRHCATLVEELAEVPTVLGNEARLGQVFLNLLVNACQAIQKGAVADNQITVRTCRAPDARVMVEVTDTGEGIPAGIADRIFDPFFTTKPVGVGTGLGLSICHGIIQSLGGEIAVSSEVGKGTTFRVLLPISDAPPRLRTPPAAQRPPRRRARVLVIDDEAQVGTSLRRMVGREHDVEVVSSGEEAARRLDHLTDYDLVLCDLMMPGLNGMDLFERVRALGTEATARFVFMTGGAFTDRAEQFVQAVSNPVVEKPLDVARLRELIRGRLSQIS